MCRQLITPALVGGNDRKIKVCKVETENKSPCRHNKLLVLVSEIAFVGAIKGFIWHQAFFSADGKHYVSACNQASDGNEITVTVKVKIVE